MKSCVRASRADSASSARRLLGALGRRDRQVAVEREGLARASEGHQREQDRRGPDERDHANARAVRRRHDRRARIGDAGRARIGNEPDVEACARRREERVEVPRSSDVPAAVRWTARRSASDARSTSGTRVRTWASPRSSARSRARSRACAQAVRPPDRRRRAATARRRGCRSSWREHVEPGRAQQSRGGDQRQADQRARVVAADAVEQHDAQRFRADRPGAVERRLAREVGVDLAAGQRTEDALDVDPLGQAGAGRRIDAPRRRCGTSRSARRGAGVARGPCRGSPAC